MRILLTIFALLFTLTAQATYIPMDCTLSVGGRCFSKSDVDKMEGGTTGVILYGYASAGAYSTLRRQNGSAGYQTTGTLTCKAIRSFGTGTSVGAVLVGYGDTDVGLNSGSTPTNPFLMFNQSSAVTNSGFAGVAGGAGHGEDAIDLTVASGKYLFAKINHSPGHVQLFCLY